MKSITQWACIALACTSGMAQAADDPSKPSVNMWGVVDVNYGITTNVEGKGTSVAAGQGGMYGSRFGVNGKSATMANGTRAIFSLEGAVNPPAPSAFQINRYGFVGLEGGFGRLRLGTVMKQADDTAWNYEALEAMGYSLGTITSWRGFGSVSNAIRYNTNDLGNKTVLDVFYSAGGVPGNQKAGSRWAITATTSIGPVDLLAYFEQGRDKDGKLTQTTQGWNGSTGTMAQLLSKTKLGDATLYAGYVRMDAADAAVGMPTRTEVLHLGLGYQVNKELNLKAGYYGLKNTGVGLTKDGSGLFSVAAQYNLGFATVYGVAGHFSNEANGKLDINGSNGTQPAGSAQNGLKLGMVYVF